MQQIVDFILEVDRLKGVTRKIRVRGSAGAPAACRRADTAQGEGMGCGTEVRGAG
jgi:hypothetical protein